MEIIARKQKAKYRITRLASTGGFLRRGNTTLMIGVDPGEEQKVIDLMRQAIGPPEEGQHRVTLFILNATHSEQF